MKRSRFVYAVAVGLILALAALLSGSTPALAIPPTVASATPNMGGPGQSLSVTVAGTDFTGSSAVSFGAGITTDNFIVDNDTQITAGITIDAAAALGSRDVSVTNVDGTGTLAGGFTVVPGPDVMSISPAQGIQGQSENVTIVGTDFTGATAVDLGAGITTENFTVNPGGASAPVQIGTGTSPVDYPFYTYWCDARTQSILLASDIGQQGQIQRLRLYCSSRPGQTLANFYIRMQHTTMSSFSSNYYVNSGWTTVLHATNVSVAGWTVPGWVEFQLTTPFIYNGVDNLLIDYCLDNSNWTSNGTCRSTATGPYRTVAHHTDLSSGNLLNSASGARMAWYNNVVLVIQADTIVAEISIDGGASSGYRDIAVTTPGGTDNLSNGFLVVAAPALGSVSPAEADQGTGTAVTLTGTGLYGVTSVGFGPGVTVNSFTVDNGTQITAIISIGGLAAVGARDVSVTNAAGTSTLSGGFMVDQAPPVIASLAPAQGILGQTGNVVIAGSYLTGATSVSFGAGITTDNFTVDSDTQITAGITIDGGVAPGYRDVTVTTPEGAATESSGFLVVDAPSLSSVTPAQAVQGQSLSVTVSGADLLGVTSVSFGSGVTVNSFTVDNATQITAGISVSPAATPGSRDVSVTNVAGTDTLTGGFTVNQAPPSIGSVSPAQGVQGQTLDIIISGSYFTGATSVDFGADVTTGSYTVDSANQVTANITIAGAATPGPRDVVIVTPGGTDNLTDGFTILTLPVITAVSPVEAVQGQALSVIISGDNLTGVSAVGFGPGISVSSFTVDNNTQITAGIDVAGTAAPGGRDVSLTKAGVTATLAAGFTVNQAPPAVESVTPNQGIQGQTENVTLVGSYFTGATAVDFGPGITANSYVVTPSAGSAEVQVGAGTSEVALPFYNSYYDARTESILLASEIGQPGRIGKLRLYCTQRPGQDQSHFYIRMQHTSMSSFPSTSFVNAGWTTVLHATNVDVDAWTVPGWVEFDLTTPFDYDGTSNLLVDYCIDNTYSTSYGYCYQTAGANRSLYCSANLAGGNVLNQATATSRLSYYANVVLVMQGDTIEADITIGSGATPGYRDVTVTTPGGADTEANGFLVVGAPSLSSVNPAQAIQGQSLSVTIAGGNLLGTTAVGFGGGVTVNSFTVDSATQITASITVGAAATPGARDVSVTNPAGTAALAGGFLVNQAPPDVTSINPSQGAQGQTLGVTISGSYFTDASAVGFGAGITTNSFTVNGPTQITANVSIAAGAALGSRDVTVTTPGGSDALASGFTVLAAPTVVSVNPAEADQGQTLSVTVTGTSFTGATAVGFGAGITVNSFTVDSDTQITAAISISGSAATGVRDVSVTRAGVTGALPGGFAVDQAPPIVGSAIPGEGILGQTENVTISGGYFTGATLVSFGPGITVNSFVVNPGTGTPEVQVGTGTAAQGYPFCTFYDDSRTQSILLAGEIGQPGQIRKLRLYCTQRPGQDLDHFYIRMQHTSMSSFPSTSYVNTGWTTVLHATNVDKDVWSVPGWIEFEFTTPFDYNGVDNLLVDYCIDNSAYTSSGTCYSTTASSRTLYYRGDLGGGNALNRATGTLASWYNNVVLVMDGDTIEADITVAAGATPGPRDVMVTTPEGSDTLENGFAVLGVPSITSLSQGQAIQGQTTSVIITGSNLFGATSVGFGSEIIVNSFTVDSGTQITASITVAGWAAPGARDVTATNPAGTGTLTSGFTVNPAPPGVTSTSPSWGIQGQTLDVTITGGYFTGATSVSFGEAVNTNSFTVDSASQITASITIGGAATPGLRDVSVTGPGGTGTLPDGYTVLGIPAVSLATPNEGPQGQTLNVTISGSSFTGATAVSFGAGITTNGYAVDSPSQITANISIGAGAAPGMRDVSVTAPGGTATLTNGFMVLAIPTVGSVSPTEADQGQTTSVTVTGADLYGVTEVSFGPGITVNSFTVDNATQITASISISGAAVLGARDVSVTNAAGTGTLTGGFTVDQAPPAIASVNPGDGLQGQAENVTITGSYFTGATWVDFGAGIITDNFTVDSDTQVTASITIDAAAAVGYRDVSVTTPEGTDAEANGFVVVATPTLTAVSPTEADQGQTASVTITGDNLYGVTVVAFGADVAVNSFTVDNATQITASISVSPLAATGARDVSVTNAAGTATLAAAFTVDQAPPAIASVSPAQGLQGQTDNVTITGIYFTGATVVDFGAGVTVSGFTVDNDTQITASINIEVAAAAGYRDVSVTTPEGTDTEAGAYLVVGVPTVTMLSPAQATQGQALAVTITGGNFPGVTGVSFGSGITVNSFTVDSATQITAGITVGSAAVPGARDVTVTNAAGTALRPGGFTVNQALPAIGTVSPRQGMQGQTLNVMMWGNYFTGASAVSFGADVTVNSFSVNNSSQITASITIGGAAAPGARDVTVTTPAGTSTLANGFTVAGLPVIASVSPGQGAPGDTISVTITGAGFTGATAVSFGAGITTNSLTVDSASQITASITIGNEAAAGAREVTVTTQSGTGSLAAAFNVALPDAGNGEVAPASGTQGTSMEVVITGADFTGATAVSFGEGVTVESFTVDSPTRITAQVVVAADAAPGARAVSVTTPGGIINLGQVFEVQGPEEEARTGGGIPVFVWPLLAVVAVAAALLAAFLIRRRRKQSEF